MSNVFLTMAVLIIILPLLWILMISFKTRVDALSMPPNWIFTPTLDNYKNILSAGGMKPFLNSLTISAISSVVVIIFSVPAAYTFSRITLSKLRGSFFFVMTMRMVPPVVIIIPIFLAFTHIGLINSYFGVILIHVAVNIPIAIWLLKIIFDRTSSSIDESASIDGAGFVQILSHHIIPIHKLQILIVTFVSFILSWNEFFLGMTLTAFDKRPLTVAISSYMTPHGTNWGYLSATVMIALLPILLVMIWLSLIHGKTDLYER